MTTDSSDIALGVELNKDLYCIGEDGRSVCTWKSVCGVHTCKRECMCGHMCVCVLGGGGFKDQGAGIWPSWCPRLYLLGSPSTGSGRDLLTGT